MLLKKIFAALTLFAVANAMAEDQQFTPQYVDLGLPSGTLWATSNVGADKPEGSNVGADKPEGFGDYFAWGETKPKTIYEWATYAHVGEGGTEWLDTKKGPGRYDIKKYTLDDGEKGCIWYQGPKFIGDNKTSLEPTDNVVVTKWGGDWDMPTSSDLEELYKNCYFAWTTNYSGASGYVVYKAKADGDKGKVNGTPEASYSTSDTHIFLPAVGYRRDKGLVDKDKRGYYWSRSLFPVATHDGNSLGFSESSVKPSYLDIVVGDNGNRFRGYTVRPVCPRDGNTNGHDAVDLGLPSGKMWATSNIGAKAPQASGEYYAWGETAQKKVYNWSTYKYVQKGQNSSEFITKYQIADEKRGGAWYNNARQFRRMPTQKEWMELYKNCYSVWTPDYNGSGVSGWIIYKAKASADKGKTICKGKTQSASYSLSDAHIFLPAAGEWSYKSISRGNEECHYWLSTLYNERSTSDGTSISLQSNYFSSYGGGGRYMGRPVRPVLDKKNANLPIPQVKAPKYYKITIVQPENGTITLKDKYIDLSKPVKEGTPLHFHSTPAAGYTNYSETWTGTPCDYYGDLIVTGDASVTCKFKPKNAPAQTVTTTTTTTAPAETEKAPTNEKTETKTTKKKINGLFKSLFKK